MNSDGKCQPHKHTAGIRLHGPVDELTDLCEFFDRRNALACLGISEAQYCRVQENVFPPRELRIEARPEFQQSRNATIDGHVAGRRTNDTGNDSQKCCLAGTVFTNDAQAASSFHREIDISYSPERLVEPASPETQQFPQMIGR